MKKTWTLITLLLLVLAACSSPVTETAVDLISDAAAAPTEAAAETAVEQVPTCNPADIPAPGEGKVMLRFLNLSDEGMTAAWHDTGAQPPAFVDYFQLADRATQDQETFAGDEWLLRDGEGRTLMDYVASAEARQCVVVYPHFEYQGEAGEDETQEWAELSEHYETCATGQAQSPIDLTSAAPADLENVVFAYGETAVTIINNGHTIQVDRITGSQITLNSVDYQLKQFHFHAPSEHTLDGQSFPIEMHLVHKSADGKLAVVGVFITEGAENPAFAPVWSHLPNEESPGLIATGATVQVAGLLPAEQTIYRYSGSLTTPPCSENVTWSVMSQPVEMSAGQIATFTAIISGNNRPVQPVNEQGLQVDTTP